VWLNRLTCFLGPVIGAYWPVRVEGALDAVPRRGPLLLAANHASFLDPWFIAITFPRRTHFLMTRQWYDRSTLWREFFRANAAHPVADDPQSTISDVCAMLARGWVVTIFPEGKITSDGHIQRFRPGLGRMAARSGAPVVPIGLRGSFETLPRDRKIPPRVPVSVHVGEPIHFAGAPYQGPPPRAESVAFQDKVLEEICRLAGQPVPRRASASETPA
jgi:1-acyl-sn-glycerol-3-phosphate acyltransferase